jgi:hypothetical protein
MNKIINYMTNVCDIFAIPLFVLMFYYFYNIDEKDMLEYILFGFSIFGIFADTIFSCNFLIN